MLTAVKDCVIATKQIGFIIAIISIDNHTKEISGLTHLFHFLILGLQRNRATRLVNTAIYRKWGVNPKIFVEK
jgi:hypothetical protein